MDDEASGDSGNHRGSKWLGLTGASDWLRSRTPLRYRGFPMLTGAGVQASSPTEVLPQLHGIGKGPNIRHSGTSVDHDGHEFITPIVSTPKYAPKPRSMTDGQLRKLSLTKQTDYDPMRDTVENLSEEIEKQKQRTDKLQTCVDLHQKLIKDLLCLEDKVHHQEELISQLISEKQSSGKGSDWLSFFTKLFQSILTIQPIPYVLSLLDKQHLYAWLNKCLRVLVYIIIYILFKSWLQVCGLASIAYKIEMFFYGVTKMLMLPFTNRTGKSSFLDRDK